MYNAVWLFLALPKWYFSTILVPFSTNLLTLIPMLGILSLAIGVLLGLLQGRRDLLLFLLLPAASQALVVISGLMRGEFPDGASDPYLWAFILLQVAAAGYLVFRLSGARWAATALAIFSVSYARFAALVAGMSFADIWL